MAVRQEGNRVMTIAYVHTSHVLIPLFTALSKRELPGVNCFHMVDESLIRNTIAAGRLTRLTIRRVAGMIASARDGGADAVMVTCSSIGAAVPVVSGLFDFPVIRVDEAMAEQAVQIGRRVGVVATLRTTLEPTVRLLREKAASQRRPIDIVEALCENAFESVLSGDTETHDRLVSASIRQLTEEADVIVLAQAQWPAWCRLSLLPCFAFQFPTPSTALRRMRMLRFSTHRARSQAQMSTAAIRTLTSGMHSRLELLMICPHRVRTGWSVRCWGAGRWTVSC